MWMQTILCLPQEIIPQPQTALQEIFPIHWTVQLYITFLRLWTFLPMIFLPHFKISVSHRILPNNPELTHRRFLQHYPGWRRRGHGPSLLTVQSTMRDYYKYKFSVRELYTQSLVSSMYSLYVLVYWNNSHIVHMIVKHYYNVK